MSTGQRLTTSQFKVVQSAVQAKLADRTGGADEVLPEYVMVVRPRPSSTHTSARRDTRPNPTSALLHPPLPFALQPRACRSGARALRLRRRLRTSPMASCRCLLAVAAWR